jgi:hypothetical protein
MANLVIGPFYVQLLAQDSADYSLDVIQYHLVRRIIPGIEVLSIDRPLYRIIQELRIGQPECLIRRIEITALIIKV